MNPSQDEFSFPNSDNRDSLQWVCNDVEPFQGKGDQDIAANTAEDVPYIDTYFANHKNRGQGKGCIKWFSP